MAGAGTAMARYCRAREPPNDEGSLTLSSAVSSITYPVRATLSMLHEAVPFTKKGAMVLLKVRSKRGGCDCCCVVVPAPGWMLSDALRALVSAPCALCPARRRVARRVGLAARRQGSRM
jgi:hypothetical protein